MVRLIKELEAKLGAKVGHPELEEVEGMSLMKLDRLLERLDAILSTLAKKYADKAETKRAIRALDK